MPNTATKDTQAIVIAINRNDGEDNTVYGPFPSGDAASRWGFGNFSCSADWYWLPLTAPLKADDAPVSVETATSRPGDHAAVYAAETGVDYATALVHCNMD